MRAVPGDTSASPWTRGLLWTEASSTEAPAHLFSPGSQLRSALPCQATLQPAGSNLQLQHLSRINSSAPTPPPRRGLGGGGGGGAEGGLAGACGQGLARVKGNEVVLLIYCCVDFCSLCVEIGDWRWVMEPTDRWNEWMIKKNNSAFITAFKNDGCAASTVKTVDVLIFHWSHKTFM